jgi:hypothetical protein
MGKTSSLDFKNSSNVELYGIRLSYQEIVEERRVMPR